MRVWSLLKDMILNSASFPTKQGFPSRWVIRVTRPFRTQTLNPKVGLPQSLSDPSTPLVVSDLLCSRFFLANRGFHSNGPYVFMYIYILPVSCIYIYIIPVSCLYIYYRFLAGYDGHVVAAFVVILVCRPYQDILVIPAHITCRWLTVSFPVKQENFPVKQSVYPVQKVSLPGSTLSLPGQTLSLREFRLSPRRGVARPVPHWGPDNKCGPPQRLKIG